MVDLIPSFSSSSLHVKKILKILIVGYMATGKTSLIRQYVGHTFSEFYKTTIGVDFAHKDLKWDDHTSLTLQLWDIGGQERYGKVTHIYFQEAIAAFVVFDVSRISTLEMALEWKKDIDEKVFTSEEKPIPCLLIGNKIDLFPDGKWGKKAEEMEEFVGKNGFIGFVETSAKVGTGIEEAIKTTVDYVIENGIEPKNQKDEKCVKIGREISGGEEKKSDCC
jgi:small GTP-binding protein